MIIIINSFFVLHRKVTRRAMVNEDCIGRAACHPSFTRAMVTFQWAPSCATATARPTSAYGHGPQVERASGHARPQERNITRTSRRNLNRSVVDWRFIGQDSLKVMPFVMVLWARVVPWPTCAVINFKMYVQSLFKAQILLVCQTLFQ